jgi:hypothetical protein
LRHCHYFLEFKKPLCYNSINSSEIGDLSQGGQNEEVGDFNGIGGCCSIGIGGYKILVCRISFWLCG